MQRVRTGEYGTNGTLTVTVSDSAGVSDIVTEEQVKTWMKVDSDSDLSIITDLIDEITAHIENEYQIPVKSKDVVATWDSFSAEVPLPFAPVSSITSVKTIDEDGDETALTTDEYRVIGNKLLFDTIYDSGYPFGRTALEVSYVSAFSTVPPEIVLAVKKAILSHYEDRQDLVGGMNIMELPNSSRSLLQKYIRYT